MEGLGAGFPADDACVAKRMRQCAAERAFSKANPLGAKTANSCVRGATNDTAAETCARQASQRLALPLASDSPRACDAAKLGPNVRHER